MIRDMTRGNVTRHLVSFSVPIILGNLFQLAYNAVDSIVVGRFAGTGALAAVGTANPVMNIIILGVSGLCIGASVLMSEYFGARDTEKLRRELPLRMKPPLQSLQNDRLSPFHVSLPANSRYHRMSKYGR